jgi:hypothetical protein
MASDSGGYGWCGRPRRRTPCLTSCFFHSLQSGESSTVVAVTELVDLASSDVVGLFRLHLV